MFVSFNSSFSFNTFLKQYNLEFEDNMRVTDFFLS